MNKEYDFLIVGAGLTGSVCARLLADAGKRVLVLEERDVPGGNVRCDEREGVVVHSFGPHIFHTSDEEVWRFVCRFVKMLPFENNPLALAPDGKRYNLPFNMHTFRSLWGVETPDEAAEKIRKETSDQAHALGKSEPSNMEEAALLRLGAEIYELLIKGYSEKMWGKPCREMSAEPLMRLPIRFAYNNNYYDDTRQGIPEGGYNRLFDGLLKGIEVKTGRRATLDEIVAAGCPVIYTGALDELFDYELGRLEYRDIKFVTERLEVGDFQGNAVVNHTDGNVAWTRITEHRHFPGGKAPEGVTYITYEYPCEGGEEGGFRCYPVENEASRALHDAYADKARKLGIIPAGRLGTFRYRDMDDAIADAMKLVKHFLM